MKRRFGKNCLLLLLLTVAVVNRPVFAQAPSQPAILRLYPFANWGSAGQGQLVTSVAIDLSSTVWVATEDTGVWSTALSHPGGSWTNFSSTSGLSDSTCTALLADSFGRVWAGTLSHGVSVYNGKTWKNYDAVDGPLGSHVFAIAQDPVDHDIWIATENGLSRYDDVSQAWSYYTVADGLPANQITAIAFDMTGDIYVGTQCSGIGIAAVSGGLKSWRTVTGPPSPTHAGGGAGLPSSLINSILVTSDGTVYVGTDWGLAQSKDSGVTWRYIRGGDWLAIAKGEYPAFTGDLPPASNTVMDSDYVTCLQQDGTGNLWVGHRQFGTEVYDLNSFQCTGTAGAGSGGYIAAIVPSSVGLLVGTYGNGVQNLASDPSMIAANAPPAPVTAAFPVYAAPPAAAELSDLTAQISAASTPMKPGDAVYMGDDWETQGDWPAHYGNAYAQVCLGLDDSNVLTVTDPRISVSTFLGPTLQTGDFEAVWMGAAQQPQNRSSLYAPRDGKREVYTWNDNNEVYAMTGGGGDLWATVNVPEGVYKLSAYFFNDDGAGGSNRYRDYLEELRTYVDAGKVTTTGPPLAAARIVDFRGGVYKSFIVCGPSKYNFRINRNLSFNGMISAVYLDKLSGPADVSDNVAPPWLNGLSYTCPKIAQPGGPAGTTGAIGIATITLWRTLDMAYGVAAAAPLQEPYRLLAYRAALAGGVDNDSLAGMRWTTHTWTTDDNVKFDFVMARAYSLSKLGGH